MNKHANAEQHKREIIERLYQAWQKNPDLRLSQLIWNRFGQMDFFYVEDEDFIKALE